VNVAIIDLGSNTFHLLIVNKDGNGSFAEVFRQRIYVSLGEGGIDQLKPSAIQRGLEACIEFKKKMEEHDVVSAVITGTAALRTASNKDVFMLQAEAIFGQSILIIDGLLEAQLIYKGVKLLSPMQERTLIVDIGGGSTEFIIVENGNLIWAESYKLGVNVLHDLFHNEEPISQYSVLAVKAHIGQVAKAFIDQVQLAPIHTFIGSSGSFEVFESMSGLQTYKDKVNVIPISTARDIIARIVPYDRIEREQIAGLPKVRAKLIVVGMLLVEEILDIVNPERMIVTPYALKEGVLMQYLN
jgi:exopolyphosphatase / guanosine-5'-triphosphate,3'-diphosphate pyrophosphatase